MQSTSPKNNGIVLPEVQEHVQENPGDLQVQDTEEIQAESSAEAVTVVMLPGKTTEDLIAERASKRLEKKTEIRLKAEGHKQAGDALFQSKNYKAAYPQYLEAIQLWGAVPDYYISLAAVYRKLGWYEEAAHAATRALTLDPKNSEARYVRGVARLEQRLLKPAQTDFETVLEYEPSHLRARAALTEVVQFVASSGPLESDPIEETTKDFDFSFPHYDYEALEIASVSDSSECQHVGNGVPCRFYNHEGCGRGTSCVYLHAPDEKSVRDDLGKNVCIYFLLDSCKFGTAKCIYSHSKKALPKRGWWTSPEKVAKVKGVLEVAEKKAREQRQQENERWKTHVKAVKAASKPPKSAGTGKKRSKDETQEELATESKEPTITDDSDSKQQEDADGQKKKEGGQKPKANRTQVKKKQPTAGASTSPGSNGKSQLPKEDAKAPDAVHEPSESVDAKPAEVPTTEPVATV